MTATEKRKQWIEGATTAWQSAPPHVKIMAGAYVGPLLEAIQAIGKELDGIADEIAGGGVADKVGEGIGHV